MDRLEQRVADRLSAATGKPARASLSADCKKWTLEYGGARLVMSTRGLEAHLLLVEQLGCSTGVTPESIEQIRELQRQGVAP